jgi:hypothetical protein
MAEHIGEQIAKLMDYSPDPEAALDYALAARQTASRTQALPHGQAADQLGSAR